MTIWFTADLHLGHANILKHCAAARPFSSVDDMNSTLIKNWNKVVKQEDTVWVLGDFAWRIKDYSVEMMFCSLNGEKHLIRGNHDEAGVLCLPWASQQDYREITLDNILVVMSHYPFASWNQSGRKSIHLHGHTHGKLPVIPRRIDVGVDVQELFPVSWEAIRSMKG